MAVYCPICEVRVSSRAALPGHYRRAHRDRPLPPALNISREEARQRLSRSAIVPAAQREPTPASAALVLGIGQAERRWIEGCARRPLETLTGDQLTYYREQARASGALAASRAEKRPATPSPSQPKAAWVYPVMLGLLDLVGMKLNEAAVRAELEREQDEQDVRPRRVLDESKFRSGYWPGEDE